MARFLWKTLLNLNCVIQINHQPDATIFQLIILTFIYSSTCFGRFPAQHQELNDCSGSLWFTCVSWWQSYCVRGRAGPTTNTARLSPEAATAVIELLVMGGKTTETCWAVYKRQDNKLENCCIRLVIYLNCTMMHGLTNLKLKKKNLKCSSCVCVSLCT